MNPEITFRPLRRTDLTRLHGWLQRPHVREYWDDGDRTPAQVEAHYFREGREVWAYLFALDGQTAGYIQAYPVDEHSEFAAWRSEIGATWGIDLFTGEETWLGRGQAVRIIRAFITRLHTELLGLGLRRLLIDPETRNTRAQHVYGKAGFKRVATVEVAGKELALMMLDISNGSQDTQASSTVPSAAKR